MYKTLLLLTFFLLFSISGLDADKGKTYEAYHRQVIRVETSIVAEDYAQGLLLLEELFDAYDFVFLREFQIAAQLALQVKDEEKAYTYIRRGILAGWDLKSIKKNEFLTPLLHGADWELIENEYQDLKKQYESGLNQAIREQVKSMYSRDQKKALKALFRIGSKAQDRYAEKKFAPHSEIQMTKLNTILDAEGYPGERLIGNSFWMSTIVSHHNSISTDYNKKDSIYPELRPKLIDALSKGQMSPYEFANIDDWYRSVKYMRQEPSYGILDEPSASDLHVTDELRSLIFARPYKLRDELIENQEETGMNYYVSERWY